MTLGKKENIFLQLYHAFHTNDSLFFSPVLYCVMVQTSTEQLPKVKARNKLRHLYHIFNRLQPCICCESPCGSCWSQGQQLPLWAYKTTALLTEILWLLVRIMEDSLNILEKEKKKKENTFSVLEKWVLAASCPCRRLLASAWDCWPLPVEGNSIPEPGTSRSSLHPLHIGTHWHQSLFPLHILGCQSPPGINCTCTNDGISYLQSTATSWIYF